MSYNSLISACQRLRRNAVTFDVRHYSLRDSIFRRSAFRVVRRPVSPRVRSGGRYLVEDRRRCLPLSARTTVTSWCNDTVRSPRPPTPREIAASASRQPSDVHRARRLVESIYISVEWESEHLRRANFYLFFSFLRFAYSAFRRRRPRAFQPSRLSCSGAVCYHQDRCRHHDVTMTSCDRCPQSWRCRICCLLFREKNCKTRIVCGSEN